MNSATSDFTVTKNACKLCTPLGAVLAFAGVRGSMGLLHGSQGCATYIRRYLISHFREPLDVASSSFTEHDTVFGGQAQLLAAINNLNQQYQPELIGIATTCLAETIGEDIPAALRQWQVKETDNKPELVHVSTPSYRGTHRQGFQDTVLALVKQLCGQLHQDILDQKDRAINLFPGLVSPADLRYLKTTLTQLGLSFCLLPDYSETLDGTPWKDWQAIPPGGTSAGSIRLMPRASASLELGSTEGQSAGTWLSEMHHVPCVSLPLPIGITLTDRFLDALRTLGAQEPSPEMCSCRGRLADSYMDAHKYIAGIPVLIYGELDLTIALASFIAETGMIPKICATGARSATFQSSLTTLVQRFEANDCQALDGVDFSQIEQAARAAKVQAVIGNSKGYKLAKALDIPLIRLGFPIHDRFGGQRIQHLGYEGAQELFDRIVNTLLEREQDRNPVGYTYF